MAQALLMASLYPASFLAVHLDTEGKTPQDCRRPLAVLPGLWPDPGLRGGILSEEVICFIGFPFCSTLARSHEHASARGCPCSAQRHSHGFIHAPQLA